MHRSETKFGAIMEEERRFREMFGVGAQVALVSWHMLLKLGLLPEGGTLTHFLWTLCFLKVYPKQGPLCVLCGNADHKTITKWVWQFIGALAELEFHVVSASCCCYCSCSISANAVLTMAPSSCFRLFGRIDSRETKAMIVLFLVTERTLRYPSTDQLSPVTSLPKRVDSGMRFASVS